MDQDYQENGYCLVKGFASQEELEKLTAILEKFHQKWLLDNQDFYQERAVNSAYITGTKYLDESEREILFQFIGSSKLNDLVKTIIPSDAAFLNTQLFFDSANPERKNYWHRDPQYHLSIEEQKEALSGPEVIHMRLALKKERGIEVIPQTHRRWDTPEEQKVRLEEDGYKNHEDLSTGVSIELEAGDLLIFSANMIHRGLYGLDRLAFDIIFFEADPAIAQWIDEDCLPSEEVMGRLEMAQYFEKTWKLKIKQRDMK